MRPHPDVQRRYTDALGVELDETGVEVQMKPKMLSDRTRIPGDGLNQLNRRVLTYADLRSINPAVDDRPPTREIVLRLSGNMQRMIWGFDGKKFTEVGPIDVTVGERFRLVMVNETMMSHQPRRARSLATGPSPSR